MTIKFHEEKLSQIISHKEENTHSKEHNGHDEHEKHEEHKNHGHEEQMEHQVHEEHLDHTDHEQKHKGHDHHQAMMDDFKKRFIVSMIVTVPVFFLSEMVQELFGLQFLSFQGDM